MIRCVVFDFDGTLVESNTIKKQAFLAIASKHNGSEVMEQILNAKDSGNRTDIFQKFINRLFDGKSFQEDFLKKLVDEYTLECRLAIAQCSDVNGAFDCFSFLESEGIVICINSATPTNALIDIVRDRGWGGAFDLILGSPESKLVNLLYISNKYKLTPDQILMVGDMSIDLNAAEAFGARFVGIHSKESDLDDSSNTLLKDLSCLKNFLLHATT